MKTFKIQLLLVLALFTCGISAQQQNPNYDAKLADKLGADAYGMKMYTLVLLTTGINKDESDLRKNAFATHMQNMNNLTEEGKLILAGPFGKNDSNYRGIFILNTTSVEEAKQFLAADLAIQNEYLNAEYIPYYGSAALFTYLKTHDKIWKLKP